MNDNILSSSGASVQPNSKINADGLCWYEPTQTPFLLHGISWDENGYKRMDSDVAENINGEVYALHRSTSGGRLTFETDSPYIAIYAECPEVSPATMPLTGYTGFDLYLEQEDGLEFTNVFVPPVSMNDGYEGIYHFREPAPRKILLHFPLYNSVRRFWIGLKAGATILAYSPYTEDLPVVFYGSSITQGACASRPGNSYAAIYSRLARRDILCLGFSSGAHGEEQMAGYIANLPMSMFVLDYDHNDCDKPEKLKERHERFYKIVRKAHPDIPIIIMTAPYAAKTFYDACPAKSKKYLRRTYMNARNAGEPVAFLDCGRIFGPDKDAALTDRIHPNDYGHIKMARGVLRCARALEKQLSTGNNAVKEDKT